MLFLHEAGALYAVDGMGATCGETEPVRISVRNDPSTLMRRLD